MSQKEINRGIYDVLKCIIHSTDNYDRGVIDYNAVALLQKLGVEISEFKENHEE